MNGVSIYGWSDATTYNDQGVWQNAAASFEQYDFDPCSGHAANPQNSALGFYHRKIVDLRVYIHTLMIVASEIISTNIQYMHAYIHSSILKQVEILLSRHERKQTFIHTYMLKYCTSHTSIHTVLISKSNHI